MWIPNETKAYRNAGSFCALGVLATNDKDVTLALNADGVCSIATDIGRDPQEIVADLVSILESGGRTSSAPKSGSVTRRRWVRRRVDAFGSPTATSRSATQ